MRIVLDTNVLLISIPRISVYSPIMDAFYDNSFSLLLSTEVLLEYEEILGNRSRPSVFQSLRKAILNANNVIAPQVHFKWTAIKTDPDDNKFFDLAIAGSADYLVTNDAHFNEAKTLAFPKVNIVSADEFLIILASIQ